jgi:hypothetical protein
MWPEWPESAIELYRPSGRRRLSAKLVPTFADIECCVVSTTDLYDRILGFLNGHTEDYFVLSWFIPSVKLRVLKFLKTPWPESASELYWQSDRRLSTKLVPIFVDRGCHRVSVKDPYGCILGFLGRLRVLTLQNFIKQLFKKIKVPLALFPFACATDINNFYSSHI